MADIGRPTVAHLTRRRFLTDLARKWAKWTVIVGTVWAAHTVYILATTELWWHATK